MCTVEKTYFIYSASEAMSSDDGAGFWCNNDGWVTKSQATLFTEAEKGCFILPLSEEDDVQWIPACTEVEAMLIVGFADEWGEQMVEIVKDGKPCVASIQRFAPCYTPVIRCYPSNGKFSAASLTQVQLTNAQVAALIAAAEVHANKAGR